MDQFHQQLLRLTKKIVRIGQLSKLQYLNDYNLETLSRRNKDKVIVNLKEELKKVLVGELYFVFFFYLCLFAQVIDEMEEQIELIQRKMRKINSVSLELSEYIDFIPSGLYCSMEEEEKTREATVDGKRSILEKWLGWNDRQLLLRVLQELRSATTSQQEQSSTVSQMTENHGIDGEHSQLLSCSDIRNQILTMTNCNLDDSVTVTLSTHCQNWILYFK